VRKRGQRWRKNAEIERAGKHAEREGNKQWEILSIDHGSWRETRNEAAIKTMLIKVSPRELDAARP
jgi:hypothetical protein